MGTLGLHSAELGLQCMRVERRAVVDPRSRDHGGIEQAGTGMNVLRLGDGLWQALGDRAYRLDPESDR